MGKIFHEIDQFFRIVVYIVSISGILFPKTDFHLEIHKFESYMAAFNLKIHKFKSFMTDLNLKYTNLSLS